MSDSTPTPNQTPTRPMFLPLQLSDRNPAVHVDECPTAPAGTVVVVLTPDTELPAFVPTTNEQLAAAGFTAKVGQTLVIPADAATYVLAGAASTQPDAVRIAVANGVRAVAHVAEVSVCLCTAGESGGDAVAAAVEGAILSRYAYKVDGVSADSALASVTVLTSHTPTDDVRATADRGRVAALAQNLARDLCNAPPRNLTATRMAELAEVVAANTGLTIEVFGRAELHALGCGGLLGVNLGSVEEPRMIKLRYEPAEGPAQAHVSLVGKGIMYDSGGISLKPADGVHATMKNDMSGAAAVLGAMSALRALDCRTAVTGWLMCTDNMPSGSALNMGDVLTIRGGTTVEVLNTDAEGRLVMSDALVLATEEPTDAIVDIATLTGACLRTFGTDIAGVMGNNQALIDQTIAAGASSDEPLWQLPLIASYRAQLDSDVADMSNLGGPNAGSITAGLFLAEFVGDTAWAHIDIAGTSQLDAVSGWRNKGATASGTRLLIDFLGAFSASNGASVRALSE